MHELVLSKSKLLAFRQCPKRLWLEVHCPELCDDSEATQAAFRNGHLVGEIARSLYDPQRAGSLIDITREGIDAALTRSVDLMKSRQPVFEAGFAAAGALAFADVMLPTGDGDKPTWRMIEIKSSTGVKDYHRDDTAVQAFVARSAGVQLEAVSLAHIDSDWTYPGNEDYRGLLKECDLTEEAFGRAGEVEGWIREAKAIAAGSKEPGCVTGRHCTSPYECGFIGYCRGQEPVVEFPARWLPRIQSKALKALVESGPSVDMRDVPDDMLNDKQRRVKECTLRGETFFDASGARSDLSCYSLPAYFLDFETIQFAVPIWPGTRPYQQIPFQFSVHTQRESGQLEHQSFLDLTGVDPSERFAEALLGACGGQGPIFVYNAAFETARIKELAARFPKMARDLLCLNERVVDLLKVAQERYYSPSQQGSWSIKQVLPAIAPDLSYEALDGVKHGGMAADAYLKAIDPSTAISTRGDIERQLLEYCGLDTYAMVRLWSFFTGRSAIVT